MNFADEYGFPSVPPTRLPVYAYDNTNYGTANDPTSYTLVPGLSCTFTLDAPTLVRLSAYISYQKTQGLSKFRFYDGATQLTIAAAIGTAAEEAWTGHTQSSFINNNSQVAMNQIHLLAAGVHTILVKEQGDNTSMAMTERCLCVDEIPSIINPKRRRKNQRRRRTSLLSFARFPAGLEVALPKLIGYAYSNTAINSVSKPTVDTLVPGLFVPFILQESAILRITASVQLNQTTAAAQGFMLYDGTTKLTGSASTAGLRWYSVSGAGGEGGNHQVALREIRTFSGGAHNVQLFSISSTGAAATLNWLPRNLVVEQIG